ncbi:MULTISPECIES: hypothetical protein [unclassified Burkholderia]|uniref:hypothetical protein n=1 Tax=unclassified Burkholderia TaxID=2613784 RepID=UPI002AAF6BDE|nr:MULTISPECIES: hypothetical protein [unclassified Burkholderia]
MLTPRPQQLASFTKVIQAIVTRENHVDPSILIETVGMLRATGIQAYDFEIDEICSCCDRSPRGIDSSPPVPRIFICCVDKRLSTVDSLRDSAGFQLAAAAANDGAATLTVRHCVGDEGMAANRSAEYVAEVAVHLFDAPPPHPAVVHLDLHAAPGFRRARLSRVGEEGDAFTFPIGEHHLTLTPIALDTTQTPAVNAWASNLLEKMQPCEPQGMGCTCCAGTSFFTQLICNQRNSENDEN